MPTMTMPKIKWSRSYQFLADGSVCQMVHFVAPPPHGVEVQSSSPLVEGDEVLDLAKEFGIKLDPEWAQAVTKTLNIIQTTVYTDECLSHNPLEIIGPAIRLLADHLPGHIELLSSVVGQHTREAIDASSQLLIAINKAAPYLGDASLRSGNPAKWHDDANFLAFLLKANAMRRGEDPKLGSKLAPGVAFIGKALRRVKLIGHSGDGNSGNEAVYKAIARFKDRSVRPDFFFTLKS